MLLYEVPNASCRIGPNPLICDSNLVAARFNPRGDDLFDQAQDILENKNFDFLLPMSVLVESFHFCKENPAELFQWIVQPERVELLPEDTGLLSRAQDWYRRPRRRGELDLVDCLLLVYAEEIAAKVGRDRPIPIATADQPLMNIARSFSTKFTFLDVNYPEYDVV